MRLNKWLYGAMALGMITACSDHDFTQNGDHENGKISFTERTSYLGISFELPTDPTTRAEESNHSNDRFEDGTKDEYKVDTAALLLFVGSEESSAKFIGAYTLTPSEAYDQPSNDQITVSFQQAVKLLNEPNTDLQLWGLALVNYRADHFDITTDASDSGHYGDLTIKDLDPVTANEKKTYELARVKNEIKDENGNITNPATTFGELREFITHCRFLNVSGTGNNEKLNSIFMTNAPLSTSPGTGSAPASDMKIQTLAKLDKSKFKDSEQAAILDPAGCIFVERAVAKITCTHFPAYAVLNYTQMENASTGVIINRDPVTRRIKIEEVEWMVDNEEEQSFIVRNAQTDHGYWTYNYSGKYRFIGEKSLEKTGGDGTFDGNTDGHKFYRTYWCIDPNYNPEGSHKPFHDQANNAYTTKFKKNSLNREGWSNEEGADNSNAKWLSKTPLYPHENTFDVTHQSYKNSTRVIFKVKYDNATQLFAIRDELNTIYFEQDAKNLLLRHVLASPTLNDLVKDLMTSAGTIAYTTADITATFGMANEEKKDGTGKVIYKAGDYVIKSLDFSDTFYNRGIIPNKADLTDDQKTEIASTLSDVMDDANQKNNIVQFKDNVCYYAVYLQHFGDTYCPLEGKKGDTVDAMYGGNSDRYEGRYGLVRNNWYDLDISEITKIGKATVPDGNSTTSDDNEVDKWFLSARVHILSWARRTQSMKF